MRAHGDGALALGRNGEGGVTGAEIEFVRVDDARDEKGEGKGGESSDGVNNGFLKRPVCFNNTSEKE